MDQVAFCVVVFLHFLGEKKFSSDHEAYMDKVAKKVFFCVSVFF